MRNSIERAAVLFFSAAWAFPLAGCGAGGAPAAEVVVSDKTPPEVRRLAADMGLEFSDPNAPVGPDGETPLIMAAKRGNAAHVRRLIESGAVVNLGDNNGRFPLWFAVRENRVKIAELLMDAGADIGEGMLHAAARGDAAEMVRLLVVRGNANVNARNDAGETPLHIAAAHNAAEVIRNLLIHPDANVNARTPDGRTPMHYAAERDAVAAVEVLLSTPGAQVDAADDAENTALHIAALHDANRVAALLYKAGADDTAKNHAGQTAPEIAKRRINPEFVPAQHLAEKRRRAAERRADEVRRAAEVRAARAAEVRRAAEPKDAEAQVNLGRSYYNGEGVSQDYAEAVKWFRRAAEQGDAEAQNNLGLAYSRGEGVPEDKTEAAKWFRRAAEQGHAQAQTNLGSAYHYGKGVPQDRARAVKWYRRAAEQEVATAQFNLGSAYHYGIGVPQDSAEAVKWTRRAAEQGHAQAQTNLGALYGTGKGVPQNFREAYIWFSLATANEHKEAAEARDLVAANGLSPAELSSAQKEAVRRQAQIRRKKENANVAKLSNPRASFSPEEQMTLGVWYATGEGVPQDDAEAAKWWRRAAEQGDARAQFFLAGAYNDGEGVPQDDAEAAKWYRRAAKQGDAIAQAALGLMYDTGEGVPQDDAEAAKWYRRAAEQGFAPAQYLLGLAYGVGAGVPQNDWEAYIWHSLAAANGDKEAAKLRDRDALKLSLAELSAAQEEAARRQAQIQGKKENTNVAAPASGEPGAKKIPTPKPAPAPSGAESVFNRAWRSVVVVVAGDNQGGGVVVNGPNQVATNCHVVDESPSDIRVYKGENRRAVRDAPYSAEVVSEDRERDVCILSVSGLWAIPAKIRSAEELEIGEAVYAVGTPKGLDFSISNGIVSQLREGEDGKAPLIQTSAAISPGSSGGGLFDSQGRLVGLTTWKIREGENLNFAIPVDWALELR